ncbi:hypothetical protein Q5P01_017178 [Channa striata]|uniref:Ig-like domain-containing protein n=1 Tax=Channa striata TaxID=64152 RepID=A0AA88M8R8_CHASR|nr:hypothetical protein Q5P01_017178 [Channa striata]
MLGLLIHVVLLSDVASSCPEELNPLRLDPPKVVNQYGEVSIVNCTSKMNDHEGMYWYDETGNSHLQENKIFLAKSVSLSNWNVTAACKIKLSPSLECSKDVEITVYKYPDVVTLRPVNPENVMVEGQQYELMCDIISVAPVQNLTVTWYKDKQIINTTSFARTNKTPENVSSVLPVNLSREDHRVQFRCEAQLNFEAQSPVSSDIFNVSMHFAPKFNKETSDVLNVTEGADVTLNCEADGNPSPVYQWTRGGDMLGINTDDRQCTEKPTITVYKYPDVVTLNPVNPENVMVEGQQYELQCNITNVAPVQNLSVTWYKDKQIINKTSFASTTNTPENVSSVLQVNLSREDHRVQFRCEAQLNFEAQSPVSSDIFNVSMHYAPKFNKETSDVLNVTEGADVTLNCEADGNPSPVYQWTRGGDMLGINTGFTITQENASVTYTCTAANELGNITKEIHVHVIKNITTTPTAVMTTPEASATKALHCPITLTPDKLVVRFGDSARINCSTSALNVSGMGWEAVIGGTGLIESSFVLWEVEKLEIWNPRLECFINIDDRQCTVKPTVTVYKPPDYVSVSAVVPGPMVEGNEYELRCDIFNVAPVQNLTVKLCQGGETVATHNFTDTMSNSSTPRNVNYTWKLMAKSDYSGKLFTCKAELHLGPHGPEPVPNRTSNSYTAVVYYPPTFKQQNNKTEMMEINMGENVTFECHAEGNPAPEINWKFAHAKNVLVTTWGSQKNITITEATSTNTGDYICVATNKFGNATRSFTLSIKGETREGISWWNILLIVAVIIIIIIIVIIIVLYKKSKTSGQYSFMAVHTSQIPLHNR